MAGVVVGCDFCHMTVLVGCDVGHTCGVVGRFRLLGWRCVCRVTVVVEA
jgi:hypothetical protein